MIILELPVSVFSKKIIEAENPLFAPQSDSQKPVIQLQPSDLLYKHITIKPVKSALTMGFLERHLSDTIHIQLHDKLAQTVHRNRAHVGAYLNELHREKLYETMWWEIRELHIDDPKCTLQAKEVIERFCDRYDIELDIDVNYDTLYKGWTRYKQRKEVLGKKQEQRLQFFRKKRGQAVRPNSENLRVRYRILLNQKTHPLSIDDLEKLVENTTTKYPNLFKLKRGEILGAKRVIDARIYIFYYEGQRTISEIAKLSELPEKTCYMRLASFRQIVKKNAITF